MKRKNLLLLTAWLAVFLSIFLFAGTIFTPYAHAEELSEENSIAVTEEASDELEVVISSEESAAVTEEPCGELVVTGSSEESAAVVIEELEQGTLEEEAPLSTEEIFEESTESGHVDGETQTTDSNPNTRSNATRSHALDSVTGLRAESWVNRVNLYWQAVPGAEGYIIYKQYPGETSMSYRYITSNTRYFDTTADPSGYNFYRVFPYKTISGQLILGPSTSYVYAKPVSLKAVGNLRAVGDFQRITLSWNASPNAEGYIIYKQYPGETSMSYRYITSNTSFADTTADPDGYNFYRVFPYVTLTEISPGPSDRYVYSKPHAYMRFIVADGTEVFASITTKNAEREEFLNLINNHRAANGAGPLQYKMEWLNGGYMRAAEATYVSTTST